MALAVVVVFGGWSARAETSGSVGWVADGTAALVASVACAAAATRAGNRRARVAWRCQSAACGSWFLAAVGWALAASGGAGAQGLGQLLGNLGQGWFVVLVATGMWLTSRGADRRATVRMYLDGAIGASAALVVVWPLAPDSPGATLPVVYLAGTFVLVTFSGLLALTEFRPTRRIMPALFTAGIAAMAVADLRHVEVTAAGRPAAGVDSGGWLVGLLLIAAAASTYRGTTRRQTVLSTARWLTFVPYLLIGPACLTLLAQVVSRDLPDPPQLVAGAVILVAILIRQLLLLAENRTLVQRLAARERQLHHLALHDPLTGLGNRAMLDDWLHAPRSDPCALILCDLDEFKSINDRLGHPVGDELLIQVGDRLRAAVRPGDTVVRLGGDEFSVAIDGTVDDALSVARRVWTSFQAPFAVRGHELVVRASIGVAQVDAGELLGAADVAMYEAKRRGKNGIEVFRPDAPSGSADSPWTGFATIGRWTGTTRSPGAAYAGSSPGSTPSTTNGRPGR
jgi:diguanylate cyclase (GGDEF)-like protein